MNDEEKRSPGPRRWSDEWLYGQFQRQQDNLFTITHELAEKYLRAEQTMGNIREELGRLEVKIANRFIALYILLCSALIGFSLNLLKGRLGF